MEKAQRFEDLIVWQKAHKLVLAIYSLSSKFPSNEMYGLTSQLRRAAVSVPSNIAEGFKRIGANDKLRFYNIAESSQEEVKYQLLLANDLQYSNTKDLILQLEEVSKILNGLIKSFKKTNI